MRVDGHVLIVASRVTREVDGVIDRLRDRGIHVSRFSPCQFPSDELLTWRPGEAGKALSRPDAAWICDFSGWSVERSLTGLQRDVAVAETTAFIEGLFLTSAANWLNDPISIRRASRKMLQLEVAEGLGANVPVTCVTNDYAEARDFCFNHSPSIVKALATGFIAYGDQAIKLYTRRVPEDLSSILEGLKSGPLIFQEMINKVEEIRAIVIDKDAFLTRMNLDGLSDDSVDIRRLDYRKERKRFQNCTDRPDIEKTSCDIVSNLGLSYGCLDWAIDRKGNAIFLECNPMGSFKWFELCSRTDITGRIADALERRCNQ